MNDRLDATFTASGCLRAISLKFGVWVYIEGAVERKTKIKIWKYLFWGGVKLKKGLRVLGYFGFL